jgi:hypothetical protein
MMRLAKTGKIVGRIVASIVVEMGDRQARGQLQAAYSAALERIMLV